VRRLPQTVLQRGSFVCLFAAHWGSQWMRGFGAQAQTRTQQTRGDAAWEHGLTVLPRRRHARTAEAARGADARGGEPCGGAGGRRRLAPARAGGPGRAPAAAQLGRVAQALPVRAVARGAGGHRRGARRAGPPALARMRRASRARAPEPGRILSACLAGSRAPAHVPAPAARARARPPRARACAPPPLLGEPLPLPRALTGGGARPPAAGGRGGAQRMGRARAAGPGSRGPAVCGLRARAHQRPPHRLPARRHPGATCPNPGCGPAGSPQLQPRWPAQAAAPAWRPVRCAPARGAKPPGMPGVRSHMRQHRMLTVNAASHSHTPASAILWLTVVFLPYRILTLSMADILMLPGSARRRSTRR
jgi:hypothetical protein